MWLQISQMLILMSTLHWPFLYEKKNYAISHNIYLAKILWFVLLEDFEHCNTGLINVKYYQLFSFQR